MIIPVFDWLGKFISNYGIIILVLTFLIKMVLWPLTYKSYVSQAKMRILAPDIDTMFLITSLEYAYLSSTTVKEVAQYGGDLERFVFPFIADLLRERVRK